VSSSSHNTNSPLLRLPGELRNKIYEYAFGGHEVMLKRDIWYAKDRMYCYAHDSPLSLWSDLLSRTTICRQIYEETRLLPYALNTVCIDMYVGDHAIYVQELGKSQKSAIRAICFKIPAFYGLDDALRALDDCTGLTHITINAIASSSDLAMIQAYADKRGIEVELDRARIGIKLESDIED
jgi:hypothetical protein